MSHCANHLLFSLFLLLSRTIITFKCKAQYGSEPNSLKIEKNGWKSEKIEKLETIILVPVNCCFTPLVFLYLSYFLFLTCLSLLKQSLLHYLLSTSPYQVSICQLKTCTTCRQIKTVYQIGLSQPLAHRSRFSTADNPHQHTHTPTSSTTNNECNTMSAGGVVVSVLPAHFWGWAVDWGGGVQKQACSSGSGWHAASAPHVPVCQNGPRLRILWFLMKRKTDGVREEEWKFDQYCNS